MYCILDIETIPDNQLILDVFSEKVGDTLASCKERFNAQVNEMAEINGGRPFPPLPYHKPVIVTLVVVNDVGTYITHRVLKNPLTIVDDFWSLISQGLHSQFFHHIVTYNGAGFDLPVMELRAMQLGLCIPGWFRFDAKRWEDPRDKSSKVHIDLFDYIFAYGARPKAGLDVVSKLFGLPGKTGSGDNVEAMLEQPNGVDGVASYCMHDTLNTYGLLLRYLKANNCNVNPWADGPAFQSVFKGVSADVDVSAFKRSAESLAVVTRERAPF